MPARGPPLMAWGMQPLMTPFPVCLHGRDLGICCCGFGFKDTGGEDVTGCQPGQPGLFLLRAAMVHQELGSGAGQGHGTAQTGVGPGQFLDNDHPFHMAQSLSVKSFGQMNACKSQFPGLLQDGGGLFRIFQQRLDLFLFKDAPGKIPDRFLYLYLFLIQFKIHFYSPGAGLPPYQWPFNRCLPMMVRWISLVPS